MKYSRLGMESKLGVSGPLLMLDYLDVDASSGRAVGRKLSSISEGHFAGHFPGQPVLPGVLQVAGMVQASQLLFGERHPGEGDVALLGLKRVKFRSPVVPGMVLTVECEEKGALEDGSIEYQVKNVCEDGKVASSGSVYLARRPGWYDGYDGEGMNPVSEAVSSMVEFCDSKAVMEVVPHRYPFLFVDRAYGLGDLGAILGFKQVTGSEPYVSASRQAEFAGYLQIEAMAQLGCAALLSQPELKGKLGFFMSIDEAVFHKPVLAGTRLWERLSCEQRGAFGIAQGGCYAGASLVTETQIKFAVVDRTE